MHRYVFRARVHEVSRAATFAPCCSALHLAWDERYAGSISGYHPLFVFNQFGDLEHCALRPGNVHSADGWEGVLDPVVARYRDKVARIYFRADAGFANPDVYEYLEAEGIKYAIRLPASRVLQVYMEYVGRERRPDARALQAPAQLLASLQVRR